MAGKAEWRDVLLEELAAATRNALVGGPFGSDLVSSDYSSTGVPVIRGENLASGRWVGGDFVFVPLAKAKKLAANTAGPLDILFTQRGANHYRQVAVVPADANQRFIISQSQMKLTVDSQKADPLFVYYLFRSPTQQEYLRRHAIQTGVPHTNLSILKKTPLRIPALNEQRAIVQILATLDDKIELNRRMNETLEEMARTFFKSLFLDFDGTDAKGVRNGRVDELLTLSRDTINPCSFPDESFEHYSIPAFDEGREPKTQRGGDIKSNKFRVPQNSGLLSKLNPRFPRVWLPTVPDSGRSICSTEFLVAIPREGVSREYLYGLFTSSDFSAVFANLVTGTSSSHQRVKPDYLLAMEVVIPPRESIRRYTEFAQPLHERIALNLNECRTLAGLRDTLLPKLISGELRVRDRSRIVKVSQ